MDRGDDEAREHYGSVDRPGLGLVSDTQVEG